MTTDNNTASNKCYQNNVKDDTSTFYPLAFNTLNMYTNNENDNKLLQKGK